MKAGSAPSTLPRFLTSFVGRTDELRSLKALLASSRMITLTGTGGAGKSRLAVQAAAAAADLWPAGVWWVDLAPVPDPGLMPAAVVASLELPGRGSPVDLVVTWLATRRALLILDNCEHLVAACAEFGDRVLKACPQLTILATSREALGVPGESLWPVAPMAVSDGVRLFEERGRLALPQFKVDTSNLELVSEICLRLDGLPLAIELAAAHVGMMSEREITSRLGDRFRILTSGVRTVPQRQRTMIATIDWSYRLLTDAEARLFRRLSVFRGGFNLESVEAVCGDQNDTGVIDLLSSLIQKSLVVAERPTDGHSRYRLLESLHAFATEQMKAAGEIDEISRRHYEYFLGAVSSKTWEWTGPRARERGPGIEEQEWKAREAANLWAAVDWARNHVDDMGLTLTYYVAEFAATHARGYLVELLDRASAPAALRARAFGRAAILALRQGDNEAAFHLAETSAAVARDLGDAEVHANALNDLAMVYYDRDLRPQAREKYQEALSLLTNSSNRRLVNRIRHNMAWLSIDDGDYETAHEIVADVVAYDRSVGNTYNLAHALDSLAQAQLGLKRLEAAEKSFKECLAIDRDLKNRWSILASMAGLAKLAQVRGDNVRALRLAAALDRVSREWSLKVAGFDGVFVREARLALGSRKSAEAWNYGLAMSFDTALEYALSAREFEAMVDLGPLSRREGEVARLVSAGLTNKQIGECLFIAERTAEGHVERIRNKLGVRSRAEVASWAVTRGLAAVDAPIHDRHK